MTPDEQILILERREEEWKHLVRYLVDNNGAAPMHWMTGLWVDLYDEATRPLEAEPEGAQSDGPGGAGTLES